MSSFYRNSFDSTNFGAHLVTKRLILPVPFIAQAYFFGEEATFYATGGGLPRNDVNIISPHINRKYLFSRDNSYSFPWPIAQYPIVSVAFSRLFFNFNHRNIMDPRFELPY